MTENEFWDEMEMLPANYHFTLYSTGFIRSDAGECPICAVANSKINGLYFDYYLNNQYPKAAEFLGLDRKLADDIANSADGVGGVPAIREKLLSFCSKE